MLPHADLMSHALIIWMAAYALVALGLWYSARRSARIRGPAPETTSRRYRLRDLRAAFSSLGLWVVEQVDDFYIADWVEQAGFPGRLIKAVVLLLLLSPVLILVPVWLVIMGKFVLYSFGVGDSVFYE